jgi:hypothetical protein
MKAPAWGPKAEPVGYSDDCPFVGNDTDPLPEQGSASIEDLNALGRSMWSWRSQGALNL